MGLRHNPTYRIIAIDGRQAREGEYLEQIGHYNPRTKALALNVERADYWLSRGAQPTATVRQLIGRHRRLPTAVGVPSVETDQPTAGPSTIPPEEGQQPLGDPSASPESND